MKRIHQDARTFFAQPGSKLKDEKNTPASSETLKRKKHATSQPKPPTTSSKQAKAAAKSAKTTAKPTTTPNTNTHIEATITPDLFRALMLAFSKDDPCKCDLLCNILFPKVHGNTIVPAFDGFINGHDATLAALALYQMPPFLFDALAKDVFGIRSGTKSAIVAKMIQAIKEKAADSATPTSPAKKMKITKLVESDEDEDENLVDEEEDDPEEVDEEESNDSEEEDDFPSDGNVS